jgi:hypothetical protein
LVGGNYIAYATTPGDVAIDGETKNSPFSSAFVKALLQPGLQVEDVFKSVRTGVRKATNGDQNPWSTSSIEGKFFFKPIKPEKVFSEKERNALLAKLKMAEEKAKLAQDEAKKAREEAKLALVTNFAQKRLAEATAATCSTAPLTLAI